MIRQINEKKKERKKQYATSSGWLKHSFNILCALFIYSFIFSEAIVIVLIDLVENQMPSLIIRYEQPGRFTQKFDIIIIIDPLGRDFYP